ncbi:MAG: cupin domain-containing protein [Burkholderiales bacterium]|nr:cupin domain-containing protein [Burkholderiales bacterium]
MGKVLGTIDELPADYRDELARHNATPLWPSIRGIIPFGMPERRARPHIWRYREMRPLMLRAGELTPIEKAERRVLMLGNPGLAPEPFATASIFFGLQLVLPGETAPNHRHSPSAVRIVVEGEGGFTIVQGERCPMARGDLILTPAQHWHQHEHHGSKPMVWVDALDAPTVMRLDAAYCVPGREQSTSDRPDASQWRYRGAGLLPYERLQRTGNAYPQLRYPWAAVRAALADFAAQAGRDEPVHIAYVNPETGEPCMPVLGFSALMLRPGETLAPPRRSTSAGFVVIEGEGESEIDGQTVAWSENDLVAIPNHAKVRHRNGSGTRPACLIQVDDAPLQRKIGIFEEFDAARA